MYVYSGKRFIKKWKEGHWTILLPPRTKKLFFFVEKDDKGKKCHLENRVAVKRKEAADRIERSYNRQSLFTTPFYNHEFLLKERGRMKKGHL